MSRERDSEVVYELVTSKYKIAERNRLAKHRFLTSTQNEKNMTSKHRGSEPSLAQTEKADVKPIDLSVPGTPVSSRYLESFGKFKRNRVDIETDSEAENDDYNVQVSKGHSVFNSALQESLKQFTSDMEKLKQEIKSHDFVESNRKYLTSVQVSLSKDNTPAMDKLPKKEQPAISKIEKYFRESARRGSLTRDFTEVVQTFDPKIASENKNLSKPGTPVSSKFMKAEKISSRKLQPFTDNIKKLEALMSPKDNDEDNERDSVDAPEKPKRINPVPLTPTPSLSSTISKEKFPPMITIESPSPDIIQLDPKDFPPVSSANIKCDKKDKDILIIIEKTLNVDDIESNAKSIEINDKIATETPIVATMVAQEQATKSVQEKEKPISELEQKKDEKSDANPAKMQEASKELIRKESIPGTPVDSRKLFKTDSDDESDIDSDIEIIDSSEVKELARELVDKIEDLVHKNMGEDESNEKSQEKINKEDNLNEQVDKLLIIYEDNKIKEYFDQSEKDKKTFQRTFSEIESFNEPSEDVKEKVEKYFKESEAKKSLTRGFSEVVNYIEPVDIDELLKPGTPVSSKVIEKIKKINGFEDIKEEDDPVIVKGMEAFKKAHEALHQPVEFKVNEYFKESEARHTLKRDFSEVFGELGGTPKPAVENPEIKKFFEESEKLKSFKRQFSQAVQTLPPRIKDIIQDEQQPIEQKRSERACSVFSAPDPTETDSENPAIARKHGKKYGIDKYFAASLYRTAYHRSKNQRRGSEPDHRFAILEDEYVFGENDVLRSQVFQDDDSTPIRLTNHTIVEDGGNPEDTDQQNVQFWRDFLKPYTLNLQNDIVMRDELIDKYAKHTLE